MNNPQFPQLFFRPSLLCLFSGMLWAGSVRAIEPISGKKPEAPPVAPPVFERKPNGPVVNQDGPVLDPTMLWSIGQPTDEEQLYLEYINRSRANPPAEGFRLAATTDADVLSAYGFFGVDLNLMQSQFNSIAAVPPLAMSLELSQAARLHSGDMYTNQFQGHTGSNGSTLPTRVTAQGYNWSTLAENVYSQAKSVWHGHAGFNVDWGNGPGGMQTPPGHRINMHNGTVREVGIGVVDGVNGTVGPQLVTQDFGVRQNSTPFITGVIYYDFNGNNFYDVGEGIGGITASTPGSTYSAVSATSGGFAFPVPANGSYSVTFSGPGLSTQSVAQVISGRNVKLDFIPVYRPPVITGPTQATLNQSNTYTISSVGGATGYDWVAATLGTYTTLEGAETLTNVTIVSSPSYAVQTTSPKYAGNYSFHLAHPPDPSNPTEQLIYLNTTLLPQTGSTLTFYKQLGWATASQVARAQVSTNGGSFWIDIWSQAGTGGRGETSFSQVSVPLGAFAGIQTRVRFVYDSTGDSFFPQTDFGTGLYLDNIAVSNARFLLGAATNTISSGSTFTFTASAATNYLLSARARLPGRVLNWGPALEVAVSAAAPILQLTAKPVLIGSQAQLNFTVGNYQPGLTFQLHKADSPNGPWIPDTTATLQTVVPNSQFKFITATGSAPRTFYRVVAGF